MRPTSVFSVFSLTAFFLAGSCSAPKTDDEADCLKVAELAQKCLHKARDQTQEEIVADCEYGLREKEMWTWASIDCYRAVGEDCVKWVECIRKDPYPKDRPSTADGMKKVTSGSDDKAEDKGEEKDKDEDKYKARKTEEEPKTDKAPSKGTIGNPDEDE